MGTDTHPQREQRPVFVDVSGRRRRTLRVAGGIVILPTVGYVVVLLIAVLVGPTIQSQALPHPLAPLAEAPLAAAAVFPAGEQRPINVIWNGLAPPSVEATPTNPAALASRTVVPSPTRAAKLKPALQSASPSAVRRKQKVRSSPPWVARRSPALQPTPIRAARQARDEADESNDDGGGDDDAKSTQQRKHGRSSAERSR